MRRICVVTGSRAEYGLLKNLLSQLKKDRSINLQLIVTWSHLSKFYSNTYKEIQKDCFNIDKKIFMPLKKNNTKIDISRCTGNAISSFSNVYINLKPDILCQAVKKERDTRLQRISVKKEDALTVTKRKNNSKK